MSSGERVTRSLITALRVLLPKHPTLLPLSCSPAAGTGWISDTAPQLTNGNVGGRGTLGRVTTYPRGQLWAHWAFFSLNIVRI